MNAMYLALPIFMLSFVSSPLLAVECNQENIHLRSQFEVDNFQANYGGESPCDSVTGSLTISGADITDLEPLLGLTAISRTLEIVDSELLSDLDGLRNISSIGGSIVIHRNQGLRDTDGLSGITQLGTDLHIQGNPKLASLSNLSSIEIIGNDLYIVGNPALSRLGLHALGFVGSDARVLNNAGLSTLDGLSNLTSVGNDMFIQNNASLVHCRHMQRLLDRKDDGVIGPGPGPGGIPDVGYEVFLGGNRRPCNSIESVSPPFTSGFETRPRLLAHYTLNSSVSDLTGQNEAATLVNAPYSQGGVHLNGIYYYPFNGNPGPDASHLETPLINEFDFDEFTISFEFKVLDDHYNPVLVAGPYGRWIGLEVLLGRKVSLLYNNAERVMTGKLVDSDTWYRARIDYSRGVGRLLIDDKEVARKAFTIETDRRTAQFMTTNYASGISLNGMLRNLRVYSGLSGFE